MASKYYDESTKTVFDGDTANAGDLNVVNTSVDSAFQLVETDIDDINTDAVAWATKAEEWAITPEDSVVPGEAAGTYSSLHWAAKSSASATASAVAQGLSEDARDASIVAQGLSEDARDASIIAQGLSEDARDASVVAQGLSETAQANAESAETNAIAQVSLANQWAEEDEDVEVTTGHYSALHWAAKAAASLPPAGSKFMHGDADQKVWVYRNSAMTGWVIDSSVQDVVIAAKGASGSVYETAGTTAGSWTVSGLSHSHLFTHKHELPFGIDSTHWVSYNSTPPYGRGGNILVNRNLNTGAVGTYKAAALSNNPYGTDYTSAGEASNGTWRVAAAVNTLQYLGI